MWLSSEEGWVGGAIDGALSGIGKPSIVTVALKSVNVEVKQVSGKYFICCTEPEREMRRSLQWVHASGFSIAIQLINS